jgi:hypothetical protein
MQEVKKIKNKILQSKTKYSNQKQNAPTLLFVILGAATFLFFPVVHWDGGAVCELNITVCDAVGKPLL